MKKILLTILVLTFSTLSFADYVIKMPLEVAQGGTLPNGSINFVSTTSEPETPAEPVDPLDAYFNSTINGTMEFFMDEGNAVSFNSLIHQDLTLQVKYKWFGFHGGSGGEARVFVDCGDCISKMPTSFNITVDGNTYNGTNCVVNYIPYDPSIARTGTAIDCTLNTGSSIFTQTDTPYSITFN